MFMNNRKIKNHPPYRNEITKPLIKVLAWNIFYENRSNINAVGDT